MPLPQKLDFGLRESYRAWEESGSRRDEADGITVSLRFEGDIAVIEALGFQTVTVEGNTAYGVVLFKDMPELLEHDGVVWMAAGNDREIDSETAVPDIMARANTVANVGTNGLWHVDATTGAITRSLNGTGSGVIVAVIDTGIDYTHPAFMGQLTPSKKSRILRIWDQGIVAPASADRPPVSRIGSADSYGVEFDTAEVEASVNGGAPLAHKDCNGHGTHVAAIAAGGRFAPPGGNAKRVGAAPEADIIAVKLLDVPRNIRFGFSGALGVQVSSSQRFRDAVLYCLRTAHAEGKPIVINMSFGSSFEPGDGLDEDAVWVDARLNPATPADGGVNQFPKGAIVVKSSGNSGRASRRQTAKFIIPAAGSLTIPLHLKDTRGVLRRKWKECGRNVHAPFIGAIFWYRRTTPPTAAKFAVRLKHRPGFGPDVDVGNDWIRSFRVSSGPPPSTALFPASTSRHTVFLEHRDTPDVAHPAGGTIRRKQVLVLFRPKRPTTHSLYSPGIYEVRITAPAGTEVHCMCNLQGWDPGKVVSCEIAALMADGSALPVDVSGALSTDSSSVDPLGQHVITVAAYNDAEGNFADPDLHAIADFSSQGPLRDFSDPPGLPLIAAKPDIAGPGVKINAAESAQTEPLLPRPPPWVSGIRFVDKSGTSMSAPMVSGMIALMLDKKSDLSSSDVKTIITGHARTGSRPMNPPDPPSAVANAYGSGIADALESHNNTP